MRAIRTIVLRLLVDTDQPQSLRGVLQDVAGSEQHYFTDEQSLLALLHRLSSALPSSLEDSEGEEHGSHARS